MGPGVKLWTNKLIVTDNQVKLDQLYLYVLNRVVSAMKKYTLTIYIL